MNDRRAARPWKGGSAPGTGGAAGLADLLTAVARGDREAFERVYDEVSGPVYGLALRIVRDPAQSEEVAQEALVDVWRTASRYDPGRGGAMAWIMTLAHRRAVDRVRSAQASAEREERAGRASAGPAYDVVAENVQARLEREQVRRCLSTLTETQRESVTLAYYAGYTYREVAALLKVPLGTIKTRMRDGLIRLRDCLGVNP
ncbi:sigma-70 family RNA polymerase sigma factor [Actinoallomurus iriomotensis]|uniref:RNA polymerase sigma factor SigK n=1 Tax=Actinoallomurus iriomotensis TaxID=478107 RepID=A0A9W6RVI4_9ACTN|nr:sigma-70 family RNA polymerase sigma factor [Actinoallomurus iriomotensis]GLY80882.1 RNA polymerase sigma factor SigK [Actinoallomurus iriomotensis]